MKQIFGSYYYAGMKDLRGFADFRSLLNLPINGMQNAME